MCQLQPKQAFQELATAIASVMQDYKADAYGGNWTAALRSSPLWWSASASRVLTNVGGTSGFQ